MLSVLLLCPLITVSNNKDSFTVDAHKVAFVKAHEGGRITVMGNGLKDVGIKLAGTKPSQAISMVNNAVADCLYKEENWPSK